MSFRNLAGSISPKPTGLKTDSSPLRWFGFGASENQLIAPGGVISNKGVVGKYFQSPDFSTGVGLCGLFGSFWNDFPRRSVAIPVPFPPPPNISLQPLLRAGYTKQPTPNCGGVSSSYTCPLPLCKNSQVPRAILKMGCEVFF